MTYKNVVFKGGGSKTIFSAGALQALQESHVLDNVQKVAGSSAGSLFALMTSLKMDHYKFDHNAQALRDQINIKKSIDLI